MFSRYGEIRYMVYQRDCLEICEILFVKLLTYNVFWFFCSLFFTLKSVTSTTTQIMINQLEDSKRKSSA